MNRLFKRGKKPPSSPILGASLSDDATEIINNLETKEGKSGKFFGVETTEKEDKKVVKDVSYYRKEIKKEKAGKRKLFQSLVRLAEELKRINLESQPLQEQARYANQNWYEGGLWRAPQLLPGVDQESPGHMLSSQRTRLRQAVSLSDLFFNLVIVTAFTRVGIAMTSSGEITGESVLYFAVFWIIWSKEASYSTRFDNTDLSAKTITLLNCFAVLFASLTVSSGMETEGAIRIMGMSAFSAFAHFFLMFRVFLEYAYAEPNTVDNHVKQYALFNAVMNLLESATWVNGIIFCPVEYRWAVFLTGVLLGMRIPRAFLANDFHAANTKRGVLFILLLGFMLQSVVVAATGFFEYTTPDWEQYSFIGASCLLLFCIKLLYVDDSNVLAEDHALLVNRMAALFFNLGQFALLFSTTILGSGLNLLTHSYLAAAAALPGPAKQLVSGGFAAVLLSTTFIKSMHVKRVPKAYPQKAIFVGAYVVQLLATIGIAGVSLAICFEEGGYFELLMQDDLELMWSLSGLAVFLVALSMLDEGLELALVGEGQTGDEYLVHPFGFWCCCLAPEVDIDDLLLTEQQEQQSRVSKSSIVEERKRAAMKTYQSDELVLDVGGRPSELSPLLGEPMANMKQEV